MDRVYKVDKADYYDGGLNFGDVDRKTGTIKSRQQWFQLGNHVHETVINRNLQENYENNNWKCNHTNI